MWNSASPGALATRFARLIERLGGDTAAAKTAGQQRELLEAFRDTETGEECPNSKGFFKKIKTALGG